MSWFLWIAIWTVIVFWYSYFTWWSWESGVPNKTEISDEQISKNAEKSWISEDEIRSRLEAWETMRDITWDTWRSKSK